VTISRHLAILRRMTAAHIAMSLTYRGAMALFVLSSLVVPVISLLVWRAALASGAQLPVDEEFLTSYFVILSVVTMATSSWLSGFLAESIRLGRISVWIIRPGSLVYDFVANNISEKLLKAGFLLPSIAVLALVFSDTLTLPTSPTRWLAFVLSTLLGAVLVFALDVLVGSLAFWLDDTTGIDMGRILLANLLSGAMVPLALAPAWAQDFVTAQPFRFTVSFPVEILAGDLSARDVAVGFAWQLGYVVVVCVVARLVWSVGLRSYSAVGA
jgi:ABC-2 type transport system permease protein